MHLIDAHLPVVAPGVALWAAVVHYVPLIGARHLQHRVMPRAGAHRQILPQHTKQYLSFFSVTTGAHMVRRTHFKRAVSSTHGCLVQCTRSCDENASENTCWLQDIRVLGFVWLAGYYKANRHREGRINSVLRAKNGRFWVGVPTGQYGVAGRFGRLVFPWFGGLILCGPWCSLRPTRVGKQQLSS